MTPVPAGSGASTLASTVRVLVVDDDFRVARLHADAIASLPGCEVVGQARTAAEAVQMAAVLRPDLVLLDEYLPDAPGTSVLPLLGAATIVVSAANDAPTVRRAFEAGALNFVIKPFPLGVLLSRVTAFARFHRALSGDRLLDQSDVDHALALARAANHPESALPKGRSAVTTTSIRDALLDAREPMSAVEVADAVGISRATAQRYLADLARSGQVTLSLRYGTTGRPEHHYEWRG